MIAHADTYRFSVEEYHKFGEAGIFHEDDRVELLNGEIVIMAPIGKRHVVAVRQIARKFHLVFADRCVVDCQSPFILDGFSEPQPDILILDPEMERTKDIARAEDVLLVIEVADSTVRYDSTTKLKAYARAGIPEYWIVNLADNAVDVYRQPAGESYAEHFRRESTDQLTPAAFPDRPIAVADILP